MSTYPLPVPPGQAPPFAIVTDTDHRAWILIAAALGMTMTLLASGIRVFIRYSSKSSWGLDDLVLAISTVLAFVQTSLILAAGSDGLGKSIKLIPTDRHDKVQQLYYASNLLYIVSLGTSRLSMLTFLRHLTPVKLHVRCIEVFLGIVAAWTIAVFLAVALQCNLTKPWLLLDQECAAGWLLRWVAAETIGAVFEIAIFAVAVWTLVWNLQTSLQRKASIVTTFSFRLLMIVAIGLRLASLDRTGFQLDPTLNVASFSCWTQTEMNFSIIAVTIPMARVLLSNLTTHYGGAGGLTFSDTAYAYSSNKQSRGQTSNAIPMDTLQSAVSHKSRSMKPDQPYIRAREDGTYSYGITSNGGNRAGTMAASTSEPENEAARSSVSSNESQKMIIKRDVTYQVRYDT